MNQELTKILSTLPLGPVRYFRRIGSTNSEAARWANDGAPDLALVFADEQTAGRGRQKRSWFTPPDSALAFSLVLRQFEPEHGSATDLALLTGRLVGLGALAVCQALHAGYNMPAEIKWPNDVLINRAKVAGVLVEGHWQGDQLQAVILGIGVNVTPNAVPQSTQLDYPATCVETVFGKQVARLNLLRLILSQLLAWRPRLAEPAFIAAWESRLAFTNETVHILSGLDSAVRTSMQGNILGLDEKGRLKLQDDSGQVRRLSGGEIRLRPET